MWLEHRLGLGDQQPFGSWRGRVSRTRKERIRIVNRTLQLLTSVDQLEHSHAVSPSQPCLLQMWLEHRLGLGDQQPFGSRRGHFVEQPPYERFGVLHGSLNLLHSVDAQDSWLHICPCQWCWQLALQLVLQLRDRSMDGRLQQRRCDRCSHEALYEGFGVA